MDYTELDKAIFDIPETDKTADKPEKPKRKLTEKQLENLAKGRERMAEKRALKLNKDASKMMVEDKKANQQAKKEALKQIEKVEKVKSKSEEEKRKKIDSTKQKVSQIKHKYLEKAETPEQFRALKKIFETIPDSHYEDELKIKDYLLSHYNSIEQAKKNKANK